MINYTASGSWSTIISTSKGPTRDLAFVKWRRRSSSCLVTTIGFARSERRPISCVRSSVVSVAEAATLVDDEEEDMETVAAEEWADLAVEAMMMTVVAVDLALIAVVAALAAIAVALAQIVAVAALAATAVGRSAAVVGVAVEVAEDATVMAASTVTATVVVEAVAATMVATVHLAAAAVAALDTATRLATAAATKAMTAVRITVVAAATAVAAVMPLTSPSLPSQLPQRPLSATTLSPGPSALAVEEARARCV